MYGRCRLWFDYRTNRPLETGESAPRTTEDMAWTIAELQEAGEL